MGRAAVVALALLATLAPGRPAAADDRAPSLALRAGWAYGLGAEVEYRPRAFGVGLSGGYVPGYGAGGYLGLQWGQHPIAASGVVAEAGAFRGVHSPLRAAADGFGAYALAGYALAVRARLSLRVVAGAGLPLDDAAHRPSAELLAKLTFGVVL